MSNDEVQYWAGGYYWGDENKYDDFVRGGYWQIGYDKDDTYKYAIQSYDIIKKIKIGDKIAIKGIGGQHDLTIYTIGEVIDNSERESGKIKVKWDLTGEFYSGKAPRGKGAGNWRGTLLPVTRPEDIEILFNTSKKPRLKSVSINNYYTIKEINIQLPNIEKEVYFLGENGDGKTLILQGIILSIYQYYISSGEIIPSLSLLNKILKPDTTEYDDIIEPKFKIESDTGKLFKNYNSIFSYSTNRGKVISKEKFDEFGIMNIFNENVYLKDPVEWLLELDRLIRHENTSVKLDTAKKILEDLLGKFNDDEDNVKIEIGKEIQFIERGSRVQFNELSDGYKTVITWVCDLLFRLSNVQPKVTDTKEYQGIVLVDEIDLHLHPKWANKIVGKLRTWFPNIQFFFTTHSPIVLLGASREAVFYKVYKEDGVTKISQPLESISSLTANTILTSPLFGLEDAISDAYDVDKDKLNTEDHYWDSIIHKEISKRISKNAGITEDDIIKLVNEELDKLEEDAKREKN